MSINLIAVDLTSASTGTNGIVKLPFPSVQEGELAHLRVYNESGCGLTILFDNGHQEVIPAGAWPMFEIEPVVRQYIWTVTYVLPNAPVALLSAVYYFPYEGVPPTPALGNSPIGVTGGVTTSSVQTLSNETAVLGTKIIDIGTLTIGDLLDIFNDHFLWSVQQAGVAHQVLKGQTAGNPLQIGQTGDTSEVLGTLAVDQNLKTNSIRDNTNGNLCIDLSAGTGAVILSLAGLLTHILGTLTVDQATTLSGLLTAAGQITGAAAQNLDLNAVTGKQVRALINNVEQMHVDGGGLAFTSKKLFDGSGNNLADWTAVGLFIKGNPASTGSMRYQSDGANTDWQMGALSTFAGSGTGTYNHTMIRFGVSAGPNFIAPIVQVAGSATQGYDTITATQAHITLGAVLSFKGWCYLL